MNRNVEEAFETEKRVQEGNGDPGLHRFKRYKRNTDMNVNLETDQRMKVDSVNEKEIHRIKREDIVALVRQKRIDFVNMAPSIVSKTVKHEKELHRLKRY